MGATGAMGVGAISSFGNAYSQSQAIKGQAAYQKAVTQINAKLANMQAEDALKRGETTARDYKKEVEGMIGTQRVAMAAQGVDVNFGSAKDVQEQTRHQMERDILTIKSNAFREAWGYKVEATNLSYAGKFMEISAKNQSTQTLITGGMNALNYGLQGYGSYSKNNPSTQKTG